MFKLRENIRNVYFEKQIILVTRKNLVIQQNVK